MTNKEYLPWILYKVTRTTEKPEVRGPFFYPAFPNAKKMIEKLGNQYLYFFTNKDTNIWNIPQKCQVKDELLLKEVENAFNLVKAKSLIDTLAPVIKEQCRVEVKIAAFRRKLEKFKEDSVNKRRNEEIPQFKSGYSTDWFQQKQIIQKIYNKHEEKEIKKKLNNLKSKGYRVITE